MCPKCNGTIFEASVWNTYDSEHRELYDKSTDEVFQEAIDKFGFLPVYDHEGWPITFTSAIHENSENGYDLVKDFI